MCLALFAACATDRVDDEHSTTRGVPAPWIATRADGISGLDDPGLLSRPASVQYEVLLAATPEMKRAKAEGIVLSSPGGILLHEQAVDRVRRASEKVRVEQVYCSVWKKIRHREGRTIDDITALVKAQLGSATPGS